MKLPNTQPRTNSAAATATITMTLSAVAAAGLSRGCPLAQGRIVVPSGVWTSIRLAKFGWSYMNSRPGGVGPRTLDLDRDPESRLAGML